MSAGAGPTPRGQHRRRPSPAVFFWRRIAVLAVAVVLIGGIAAAVAEAAGSSPSSSGTTTTTAAGGGSGTTAKSSTTTTTKPLNPITMTAVGDTMLGNTPTLPPDPNTYLAGVESALKAPIVFGNLEGTLTNNSSDSKCGVGSTDCYAFRTPPSYAEVLRQAGFTVINSANNHSHDFGLQGVADTSAALKAAGIVQAGLQGQIGIVTDGATKVAFCDFAPYADLNNLLDFSAAKALIAKAKTEANIVVVYMHAGAEGADADHVTGQEEYYVGEDRGNAEAFAKAAIDDGASLVIASGPHVLRGMEFYKGHLIAYSLGDFANYQDFSTSGDLALSGILRVTLNGNGSFSSAGFTSVYLSSVGQPSIDPAGNAAQFVNSLSTADFGSAAAIIGSNGQIAPASS